MKIKRKNNHDHVHQHSADGSPCIVCGLTSNDNNYYQVSFKKKKTIIHVNQHIIKKNKKYNEINPPLTCKSGKENKYASNVIIYDKYGQEAARVVYRPDKPLSCGARVWIETMNKVKTI